ncbi:hypothetical protein K488DRAFT_80658 [Vararia minispora EC-137]|uniref:Uncharacterized protein n=1 Tax=Vararia minispora EC-137 TaxID=1314806 RepID=A0ACB8QA08_9AGAM|nr:hypothetical protein K488DRAFT_80658 [Vararia minispora EC-137]
MPAHIVFLGAPSVNDPVTSSNYAWTTITCPNATSSPGEKYRSSSWAGYAPATLKAASRRISMLYENIIFSEQSSYGVEDGDMSSLADDSAEQMSAHLWNPAGTGSIGVETFLYASPSRLQFVPGGETQVETQQTTLSSDESSFTLLPSFRFHLSNITSLSALRTVSPPRRSTVLVAVLELDGPDFVRIKNGADAGKEIAVLKIIVGDDDGAVAKCTAWRDVAKMWGDAGGLKRGDVVCFSNVQSSWDRLSPLTLTASPSLKSQAEICYRTMPRASFAEADGRLRPELALAMGDPAVRRVTALVQWFEKMAGLPR